MKPQTARVILALEAWMGRKCSRWNEWVNPFEDYNDVRLGWTLGLTGLGIIVDIVLAAMKWVPRVPDGQPDIPDLSLWWFTAPFWPLAINLILGTVFWFVELIYNSAAARVKAMHEKLEFIAGSDQPQIQAGNLSLMKEYEKTNR